MRRWLGVLVAGFVLGGASPALAVTNLTVTTPTTGAEGARTDYVIGFTNGSALSGVQTISVTFPPGTTFDAWRGGTVAVGGTGVGSCSKPGTGSVTSSCGLFSGRSIAAGA